MPKIEQPELEPLELTLFSAGQIPREARVIIEMARRIGGESNRPFALQIERSAVDIIRLARKAIAEQSRYADLVGYKHLRKE